MAETQVWTEARVAALKQLCAEGLSFGDMARRLGGVSRNQVIGKVHRMGLGGRSAETTRLNSQIGSGRIKGLAVTGRGELQPWTGPVFAGARLPARFLGEAAPLLAPAPPPPGFPPPRPFHELAETECVWSYDDPGLGRMDEMACCGAPRALGSSYCPAHLALSLTAAGRKLAHGVGRPEERAS